MDDRSIAGLLATLAIVAVAAFGAYGFGTGSLANPSGAYFAPTIASLAIAVVVVGALTVVGARSKRWLENPYW
ncbi:hypothetical protein [Natrinema salifodinae]|uniref:Uncharacterized protein n=1 Tax=Natrinema salifodinae TaxID=1202768 RepID=A0A1I0N5F9_9EURY|nr:hypothetical protein [Natrinema salifodinae]SEV96260.1 hypothetical protein SAMN05216285_1352 [Natrinema salifodinae]